MMGDQGLQEDDLQKDGRKEERKLGCHQRLAGDHRQILGGDAAARYQRQNPRALFRNRHRRAANLSDRLPRPAADRRAGRDRLDRCAAVRRRQGSVGGGHQFPVRPRRLQSGAPAQPFRSADRLGLVLLHHQADVPRARLLLPPRRQFRPRNPDRHGHRQAPVLPARQQVLRVDGEDEGGAAADRR